MDVVSSVSGKLPPGQGQALVQDQRQNQGWGAISQNQFHNFKKIKPNADGRFRFLLEHWLPYETSVISSRSKQLIIRPFVYFVFVCVPNFRYANHGKISFFCQLINKTKKQRIKIQLWYFTEKDFVKNVSLNFLRNCQCIYL